MINIIIKVNPGRKRKRKKRVTKKGNKIIKHIVTKQKVIKEGDIMKKKRKMKMRKMKKRKKR